MNVQQQCIQAYRKHQNLKIAAEQVGIPWQTVYVHLRKAGEPVTGDKCRYGSETDRLAARAEREFTRRVPFAEDQNKVKFQSKVDFLVGGYSVDVKAARLRQTSINASRPRGRERHEHPLNPGGNCPNAYNHLARFEGWQMGGILSITRRSGAVFSAVKRAFLESVMESI